MSMEKKGEGHKVEKMFTLDTPHQGANVPLGLLNMADMVLGDSENKQKRNSLLSRLRIPNPTSILERVLFPNNNKTFSTTAAYEMAINNPGPNPTRTAFLAEMSLLGSYPSKTRNIAIACGASDKDQEHIGKGGTLFSWEIDPLCLVDKQITVLGKDFDVRACPLTFNARAWAMPGNDIKQIARLNAGYEFGINSNFIGNGISRYSLLPNAHDPLNAPIGKFNVDHVPGGYLSLPRFGFAALDSIVEETEVNWTIIKWRLEVPICVEVPLIGDVCKDIVLWDLDWTIKNILGELEYVKGFSFVPTVSALDLNTNDWNIDINTIGNYPNDKSKTPFDAMYWSDDNHFHAALPLKDENMSKFVFSELSPAQLFVQNRVLDSDYVNTFEAREKIVVGKNVDLVPNRTLQGDVVVKSGANVTFSIGADKELVFEDGVDIEFGSEITVIENDLDENPVPSLGKDLFSPSNPTSQRKARKEFMSKPTKAKMIKAGGETTVEIVDHTPKHNLVKYKRPIVASISNTIEVFDSWLYPTTTNGDVVLNLSLPVEDELSINIVNSVGQEVLSIVQSKFYTNGSHKVSLETSLLTKGLHIVQVKGKQYNKSMKLIIE